MDTTKLAATVAQLRAAYEKSASGLDDDIAAWYVAIDEAAETLFAQIAELISASERAAREHDSAMTALRAEHQKALAQRDADLDALGTLMEKAAAQFKATDREFDSLKAQHDRMDLKITELRALLHHIVYSTTMDGRTIRDLIPAPLRNVADITIARPDVTASKHILARFIAAKPSPDLIRQLHALTAHADL